jgi:hypothetical protein
MRLPGRHRRGCEDINKMDVTEIGREVVNWIGLVNDRGQYRALVKTVMNLWVPQKAKNLSV